MKHFQSDRCSISIISSHNMTRNMKYFLSALIFLTACSTQAQEYVVGSQDHNVHQFTMTTIDGEEKALSDYAGDVLLIVNTASKCGYTKQYAPLQELYEKYRERGFEVLAFPANNFGQQEPGTNEEIKEFCSSTFDVTFPLFSKISVKGKDKHPLYAYLTGIEGLGGEIQWNFTKFLVGRDGNPVARFGTRTDPLDERLLSELEKALKR